VIAHVVLFRPRPTLSETERADFVAALDAALAGIPQIKRTTIGRRVVLGRQYDAMNAVEFPYVAILEFESKDDLVAYLDHPAHARLGLQFYTASEAAVAYDFDVLDPSRTSELLG
jgi:hypothetical protein